MVTIDGISGRVSRIATRATTVVDFDNKDDGAVNGVEKHLRDDAEADGPAIVRHSRDTGADLFEDLTERLGERADVALQHRRRGGGRMGHFAKHQRVVPPRPIGISLRGEHAPDEAVESGFRRQGRSGCQEGLPRLTALSLLEAGDVERLFVTEVVVDGGDIDACIAADVTDARPLESAFGERPPGCIDQPPAHFFGHAPSPGAPRGANRRRKRPASQRHEKSNDCFKQSYFP